MNDVVRMENDIIAVTRKYGNELIGKGCVVTPKLLQEIKDNVSANLRFAYPGMPVPNVRVWQDAEDPTLVHISTE